MSEFMNRWASSRPDAPILLLLPLLLLVPGFVHAQTRRTFTPRVSVEETYDDNINLDSKGKNPDWITTVSPGFNFAVDSQHTKLNLDGVVKSPKKALFVSITH